LRRIKSGSEQREYLKTLGFVLSENHGEGFYRPGFCESGGF